MGQSLIFWMIDFQTMTAATDLTITAEPGSGSQGIFVSRSEMKKTQPDDSTAIANDTAQAAPTSLLYTSVNHASLHLHGAPNLCFGDGVNPGSIFIA